MDFSLDIENNLEPLLNLRENLLNNKPF